MLTDAFSDFSVQEYEDRLSRLRQQMAEQNLDAVLLTTDTNHRYFTGHWTHRWLHKFTSLFAILPLKQDPVLIVPPLETGLCELDSWITDVRTYPPPTRVQAGVALITQTLQDLGLAQSRIGAELGGVLWSRMPVDDFRQLCNNLPQAEFTDASPLIWATRTPKSPAEVAYIKQAVQITDQAYRTLFETVQPGTTEKDMLRHMAVEQLQHGADAPGSITIATHDAQNLQPSDRSHRRATSRALMPGDLAILDAGCVYHGYWSDYTRMFALGHTSDRCKHAYHTIYTCLQAALNAVKPGILARELVEVSNRVMLAAGYTEQAKRATGCGHASGLDIIEPPFLELASSAPLEAGMILTVEPSMVTDFGFFMLEEDILVTDTGYELLSEPVPEELPVL